MSSAAQKAIVMGASAGAVEALMTILPALPKNFALPIMVVVHLPPDKDSVLAEVMQNKCRLVVREAADKEPIMPGTVYVAPPDYHLLVEKNGQLSLSADESVMFSRPSIDVLFETAADAYGSNLIGVILTGANSDGAKGLRSIVRAGGTALVQAPQTAHSRTMPDAAIALCPEAMVLTLPDIAAFLERQGGQA